MDLNLGFPVRVDELWCIEVHDASGKIVPCAFSQEQALEIAHRIINYYGASQAGARSASGALGGPEAVKKPIAKTA